MKGIATAAGDEKIIGQALRETWSVMGCGAVGRKSLTKPAPCDKELKERKFCRRKQTRKCFARCQQLQPASHCIREGAPEREPRNGPKDLLGGTRGLKGPGERGEPKPQEEVGFEAERRERPTKLEELERHQQDEPGGGNGGSKEDHPPGLPKMGSGIGVGAGVGVVVYRHGTWGRGLMRQITSCSSTNDANDGSDVGEIVI